MKRSHINQAITQAEEDFTRIGFHLPKFANWRLDEWQAQSDSVGELVAAGVGWDVTDYGKGQFDKTGLLLFTLRNGRITGGQFNRPYAEKLMVSRRDQLTPMHRHGTKIEDIINRGSSTSGARLAIKLYNSNPDGSLETTGDVIAHLDGVTRRVAAGDVVYLEAGQSITLFPGIFHAFWGDGGDVVAGEVSSLNDDLHDNYFAEPIARFADIEEDAPAYRPLVPDIANMFKNGLAKHS